jgi:hypothetical protein
LVASVLALCKNEILGKTPVFKETLQRKTLFPFSEIVNVRGESGPPIRRQGNSNSVVVLHARTIVLTQTINMQQNGNRKRQLSTSNKVAKRPKLTETHIYTYFYEKLVKICENAKKKYEREKRRIDVNNLIKSLKEISIFRYRTELLGVVSRRVGNALERMATHFGTEQPITQKEGEEVETNRKIPIYRTSTDVSIKKRKIQDRFKLLENLWVDQLKTRSAS